MQLLIGVLLCTHLLAAVLVLQQHAASRPVSALLLVTVGVVVLGQLVPPSGLAGGTVDAGLWLARTAVGAAWLGIAWATLRRTLEDERQRIDSFEHELVDATREQRERMHELRSTVAGLVSGSAMLDRPDVPAETRQQLWLSVRRELDRMDRLLSGQDDGPVDVDLDEATSYRESATIAPGEEIVTVDIDGVTVGLRHPEHLRDDVHRQLPREVTDPVELAGLHGLVEVAVGDPLDRGL